MNNDAHLPEDLVTEEKARKIAAGAGLTVDEIETMFSHSQALVERITVAD